MDSLGSNHSIPSMSVSTGSQSSSVSSMQEVLDESSPELVMMHSDESTINSTSSVVHKKVCLLVLSIASLSLTLAHLPRAQLCVLWSCAEPSAESRSWCWACQKSSSVLLVWFLFFFFKS